MVEEKFINAQGFIADDKNIGSRSSTEESSSILRVTQQAKPRSCITDAMSILVRLVFSLIDTHHYVRSID